MQRTGVHLCVAHNIHPGAIIPKFLMVTFWARPDRRVVRAGLVRVCTHKRDRVGRSDAHAGGIARRSADDRAVPYRSVHLASDRAATLDPSNVPVSSPPPIKSSHKIPAPPPPGSMHAFSRHAWVWCGARRQTLRPLMHSVHADATVQALRTRPAPDGRVVRAASACRSRHLHPMGAPASRSCSRAFVFVFVFSSFAFAFSFPLRCGWGVGCARSGYALALGGCG